MIPSTFRSFKMKIKIQIEIEDALIAIDAINLAVGELQFAELNTYVPDLIALRDAIDSAAKEQREGRANQRIAVGDLAKDADAYFSHFGDDH